VSASTGFRSCRSVAVLGAGLALVACGGAGGAGAGAGAGAAAGGGPPDGLRAASGYAAYEGCGTDRSACAGGVPAALRRPLHLPRVTAGAGCPVTRAGTVTRFVGRLLGAGPVYPVLSGDLSFAYPPDRRSIFAGSRWGGQKVLWVGAPAAAGPVLIRGRQLDGPRAVGFGQAGVPVDELQLLASGATSPGEPAGWREWPSYTRLRAGGCYGYQVDGRSFSTAVVIRAATTA
jgi:hypothetical protein